MPGVGVADQKRMVEALLARGIDGIAISPIDPDNQTDLLNEAATHTNLITHDSDAPASNRLCFIGIDNYSAGRECGKLVKEALPDGGNIMIFVGRLEQLNARQRRQGVIDELLDRSFDPERRDPNSGPVRGEKYTVLDTRTDQFDYAKAKAQVEDAIAKYPDLHGVVGLFAYNPPLALEAILTEHEANRATTTMMRHALEPACVQMGDNLARLNMIANGIELKPERMRRNVDLSGGMILAEAIMLKLGENLGRQEAHDVIYDIAQGVSVDGGAFDERLMRNPEVQAVMSVEELNAMLDPAKYTGLCGAMALEQAAIARRVSSELCG